MQLASVAAMVGADFSEARYYNMCLMRKRKLDTIWFWKKALMERVDGLALTRWSEREEREISKQLGFKTQRPYGSPVMLQ